MRRATPYILLSSIFVASAIAIAHFVSLFGSSLFEDWRLVFQQMESSRRWVLLSLGCGVAVGLIAMLHQYERALISRPLGWTLLLLRLGLILVVFLALLEPVWSWSYDEELSGRVVVALDVSESMDTKDEHALLLEKLQWAQSLGIFGNDEARERADRWTRQLERGDEPEWVTPDEEPDEQKRLAKAKLRREDLLTTLETVTDYSRKELAARALVSDPQPLLPELGQLVDVDVSIFAEDHLVTDAESISKLIDGGEVTVQRSYSALIESMKSALEGEKDVALSGLILVSDGRDTSELERKQVVQRLAGLGVPVHTVMVGSERRPRDLAVAHIDAPESVFEDDTPLVTGTIQTFGFENEEIEVFLDWLDDPERDPLKQTIVADGSLTDVAFSIEDLDLGRHHFRLRTAIQEDELRDDNNSRDLAIKVVDDRAQVMLIENEGRWEFRYLTTALERDKRLTVEHVLFEQPYLGVLNQPFFSTALDSVAKGDEEATRYADYDCVIIGDVSPRHMPLREWKELDKYVREEGGTLILTAGKNDFPMSYRGTIVDGLMPVRGLDVINLRGGGQTLPPQVRGFKMSITPDGERLPMFQLGDDLIESRRIWAELPGHTWGITGKVKGGATVYAAALRPGERNTLKNERENAVIAQHYVGTGQVMWVGVDSTWRWRFRVGDLYHHRFWGQVIRWAVGFKTSSGNSIVRLGLTPAVINENETTTVRARWDEQFARGNPELQAFALIESTTGSNFRQRVELQPNAALPFTHEAELKDLDPGEYLVTIDIPDVALNEQPPEETLIVNEVVSRELIDISSDRALLEEIAMVSGGRFVRLHEIGQLTEEFAEETETVSLHEEIPLWSHWTVMVLFCGIAMTEWVTRKLNGLP